MHSKTASTKAYEYLGDRFFLLTLLLALLLHASALFVWVAMPHARVEEVTIRALNIKLGDGDASVPDDVQGASPPPAAMQNVLSHLVHDMAPQPVETPRVAPSVPAQAPATLSQPVDRAAATGALEKALTAPPQPERHFSDTTRQYVRETQQVQVAAAGNGSTLGNSKASNAEKENSYNQTISMWVRQFTYRSAESNVPGMKGTTVVSIHLDRRGNILDYKIKQSSGYVIFDQLAINILRRANPVPPMPDDFHPGEDTPQILLPLDFEAK